MCGAAERGAASKRHKLSYHILPVLKLEPCDGAFHTCVHRWTSSLSHVWYFSERGGVKRTAGLVTSHVQTSCRLGLLCGQTSQALFIMPRLQVMRASGGHITTCHELEHACARHHS